MLKPREGKDFSKGMCKKTVVQHGKVQFSTLMS